MKSDLSTSRPGTGRDSDLLQGADQTAESQATTLQEQVQQLHDEQSPLSDPETPDSPFQDSSTIEQDYREAVAVALTEKEAQAESLENRLESLIEKQESALQQLTGKQPGILSMPGQRQKWQNQVQQQQALVSRLHSRLDTVKELHEGMGLHGPKLQEMATEKVRRQQPELADSWDELREARRAHEAHMRLQEKQRKEKLRQEQSPSVKTSQSKGNSLSLSRSID